VRRTLGGGAVGAGAVRRGSALVTPQRRQPIPGEAQLDQRRQEGLCDRAARQRQARATRSRQGLAEPPGEPRAENAGQFALVLDDDARWSHVLPSAQLARALEEASEERR